MVYFIFICSQINLNVPKVNNVITIDGILKEDEYSNAMKINGFTQFSPVENLIPLIKTEVFIGLDDVNLYLGIKCFEDNISCIRANIQKRDNVFMDDLIIVYLDTDGDLKDAYIFGVNPKGSIMDGIRKQDTGDEDYTLDLEWEAKSMINNDYWVLEIRIPFSSLVFSKGEWKIIILRTRPRDATELYAFPYITLNKPGLLSQGKDIKIDIDKIRKKRELSIIPYFLSSQEGYKIDTIYNQDRVLYKAGLSSRFLVLQSQVVDITINPDYAEIEADEPQITINNPYAIYYTEKRPFFLEKKSILDSPIDILYTRSINNPLIGIKTLGNIKGTDYIAFSGIDRNTVWIVPFEDFSVDVVSEEKSYSGFLRTETKILKDFTLGSFIIGRKIKDGYNGVISLDGNGSLYEHLNFNYQVGYSRTKEMNDTIISEYINDITFDGYTGGFDGEEFKGYAGKIDLNLVFKHLYSGISYYNVSPLFRTDLGYIEKNNTIEKKFYIKPVVYPNKYGIRAGAVTFLYEDEYNHSGIKKGSLYKTDFYLEIPRQTKIRITYRDYEERYWNTYFDGLWDVMYYISSMPLKFLRTYLSYKYGRGINYNNIDYCYQRNASFLFYFTPLSFINIEGMYSRRELFKDRFDSLLGKMDISRIKMEYYPLKNLSIRIIGDYYHQIKQVAIMPMIMYQPSPFTIFLFGVNTNGLREESFNYDIYSHNVYLKFQYTFKM